MVEVVRGIRYRNPGDKIFGRPIKPVPERIGPAVARNGARRETSPGSSRREVLTLRGLVQVPHTPAHARRKANASALRLGPRASHLEKIIVAAAGLCASRAARPYHPPGPAESQTTLP